MTLRIDNLSFGFGSITLLSDADFEIQARGITLVMGPAGVGKSTLLRMLVRRAQMAPSFWHRGHVLLDGIDILEDMSDAETRAVVALFGQKGRLYTASVLENLVAEVAPTRSTTRDKRELAHEVVKRFGLDERLLAVLDEPVLSLSIGAQRCVAIARACSGNPQVLLVDEPTRDITDEDALTLEALLQRQAEERAIVMVTHDQRQARRLGRSCVLLAAGRVVAQGELPVLFDHPPCDVVRRFVASGNCWDEARPARAAPAQLSPQPSGFNWIVPGRLAGMARPGLLREVDDDVRDLHQLGIHTLVSLEEVAFDHPLCAELGVRREHLPIVDMGAPTVDAAMPFLERACARMRSGRATVFHCKGGLGRTGMMMAACLVLEGATALKAVEEVRSICAHYVQSPEQLGFLSRLQRHCHRADSREERS